MPRSFPQWRALVRVSAEYPPITELYADEVIIDLPKATSPHSQGEAENGLVSSSGFWLSNMNTDSSK
jgi:hypothetical protein